MVNALKTIYSFIMNAIVTVLTFSVPIYIILLLIIMIVFWLKFIKNFSTKDGKDSLINYKEDVIEDVRWVWDWDDYYGKLEFKKNTPIPICIHCKGYLIEDSYDYNVNHLFCENCKFKKRIPVNYYEYQEKIVREIHRRIRVKFD